MDPTSLERLAALKRRLPQKLSLPEPKPAQGQPMGRHPLEITQDPEKLFAELIDASPDGDVPQHLLERLRGLEQQRGEGADGQAANQDGMSCEQEQYRVFEALLGDDEGM